jgi:uroporphyrin-III C-methyltransferase/precorrin-2 dehydrogenase/sirohydrochlorin ferrochelatase
LANLIEREQIKSPALLIIGEVANLSKELAWFGNSQQTHLASSQLLTNAA